MSTKPVISSCTRDCPDCCSILMTEENGKPVFRGNPNHPFTQGFICKKTRQYPELLTHPQRITRPMVRSGAGYWDVDWEDAFRLIAKRINKLRHKPERMLHIRGFGYRGVLADASKWFFGTLGSSVTTGSPCDEAGIAACEQDFGALDTNHIEDLLNASHIVNWGRDFSRFSIHQAALIKKARKAGTRVLTITPGGCGNAPFSDVMITIRPGTDRFLAAALAKELIAAGIPKAVAAASANFDELSSLLDAHDTAALIEACGISANDFAEILSWYHKESPTATIIGWGLQRYVHGGETVRWINAAAMLSGSIGVSGGGAYYNISSGRNFVKWANEATKGKERRELKLHDIGRNILHADPPVDFVWIDGTNVVNQLPGCDAISEALGKAEMVVAVDSFFNDTSIRADVILPCALMGEREDAIASNMHDWVNWCGKAYAPPGEAKSDWEILEGLGAALDDPISLPDKEDVLSKALSSPALNITPDELRTQGFAKADWPEIAFEGMRFSHFDSKFRFISELSPSVTPDRSYPLQLLTLIHKNRLHSQTNPDEEAGMPTAWVNPESPHLNGIDATAPVRLVTQVDAVPVNLSYDSTMHPDAVIVRRGGWLLHNKNVNRIIAPAEADLGGGVAYYSQCCKLENV